jgi:uncharacterized protein DUF5063
MSKPLDSFALVARRYCELIESRNVQLESLRTLVELYLAALELPLHREAADSESRAEPYLAAVSQDLADIWADLKRGLNAYERGDCDAALWDWGFGFKFHWGRHLVDALAALHYLEP